jgi:hypothetical protein
LICQSGHYFLDLRSRVFKVKMTIGTRLAVPGTRLPGTAWTRLAPARRSRVRCRVLIFGWNFTRHPGTAAIAPLPGVGGGGQELGCSPSSPTICSPSIYTAATSNSLQPITMTSTQKRPKASCVSSASSTYPTENLTETTPPPDPNESAAPDAEEDLTTPASTQPPTDISHEASDLQELSK